MIDIQCWDIDVNSVVPRVSPREISNRAMQAGEQFLAAENSGVGGGGGDFVVDCVVGGGGGGDGEEEDEIEFDVQTQRRLDAAVDKLLKGYDWTLAPLANKYALNLVRAGWIFSLRLPWGR